MIVSVGIDVSKSSLDVCILAGEKEVIFKCQNNKNGFVDLLKKLSDYPNELVRVCLESTGFYHREISQCLHNAGYFIAVENPARISYFARMQLSRLKTDKQDARLIARYCQTAQLRRWIPPTMTIMRLSELIGLLRFLRSIRASAQVKYEELQYGFCRDEIRKTIQGLDKRIEQVIQDIRKLFDANEELKQDRKLLMSVPGIGELTAAILLTVFKSGREFRTINEVVAFFGLNPKSRQSGSSILGKERISKIGKSELRAALYMPALSVFRARKYEGLIARLEKAKKNKLVIVTAIMRKILVYAFTVYRKKELFRAI